MSVFIGYPSFMAYQMMKGKKDNNEGFPSIPGTIARYSALGLTNEEMSKNPVWVDKTGNGHGLQMKNFAWGGMSGVNGYVQNFNYFRNNATVDKVRIDEQSSNSIKVTLLTSGMGHVIYIPKNIYQFNKSYFIKISSEGYNEGDLFLSFYAPSTSTATTVKVPLNPNGITEIPAIKEDDFLAVYLFNAAGKVGSITIEQLPLYPGALVFDGVDDYGVCENFPILNKEKGYTVVALRRFIYDGVDRRYALMTNADPNGIKDGFILELVSPNSNKYTDSFGSNTILSGFEKSVFTYQTSKYYNGAPIKIGEKLAFDKIAVGTRFYPNYDPANVAIWEICILDHDATEEELTKIKDYFVKTYPWLFPDQAWTVAGKTNEDEDRATIANITGNGNNLVLSNFGFAEGSGYNEEGEYAGYLVTDGVDDKITSSAFKMGKDFTVVGEWKFLKEDVIKLAGFVKYDAFMFYNYSYYNRINIYIYSPQGVAFNNVDTIKAVTSEGQVYFDFNSIKEVKPGDLADKGYVMNIGHNGSNHTKLALKNFAIYPTVLSKDDCIKAYNYLQTLKAK